MKTWLKVSLTQNQTCRPPWTRYFYLCRKNTIFNVWNVSLFKIRIRGTVGVFLNIYEKLYTFHSVSKETIALACLPFFSSKRMRHCIFLTDWVTQVSLFYFRIIIYVTSLILYIYVYKCVCVCLYEKRKKRVAEHHTIL